MRAAHAGLERVLDLFRIFSARNDKICVKVPNSLVDVLTFYARFRNVSDFTGCRRAAVADSDVLAQTLRAALTKKRSFTGCRRAAVADSYVLAQTLRVRADKKNVRALVRNADSM